MPYREPLPPDCPPEAADEITDSLTVYRLVWHDPPLDCDFRSQLAENPDLALHKVTECQARGLSVFTTLEDAMLRSKSAKFRGSLICEVTLGPGAGHILKTGRRSHHTWWPLADYPIRDNCRVVEL